MQKIPLSSKPWCHTPDQVAVHLFIDYRQWESDRVQILQLPGSCAHSVLFVEFTR